MPLNNPATGFATLASGTYTGDDSVNKAIPHGLAVAPQLILIISNQGYHFWLSLGDAGWISGNFSGQPRLAVTAIDATNFYVGNATSYPGSANQTAAAHYWTAVRIS